MATVDTKTHRTMSTATVQTSFVSEVSSDFSLEEKLVTSNVKGEMWKTETAGASEESKVQAQRRHTFSEITTLEPLIYESKKYRFAQLWREFLIVFDYDLNCSAYNMHVNKKTGI